MKVEPVKLIGTKVVLEPMSSKHMDELAEVGLDERLWEFAPERIATRERMRDYVDAALSDKAKGTALPFVTKIEDTNKIVGSSRFGNIDAGNRKAEIGWTWVIPAFQRSVVNTEAKLLMLTHAFETWECIRVEFKTDATNLRSRNAIVRLGAKEEGTLRQHMITESGRFRDSVYFSILDNEWERVKAGLIDKVRKYQ